MGANAEAAKAAYDRVVRDELSWLLLHYPNDKAADLELYCSGSQGLEEMKNKIYDLNQIFVAFYREENEERPGYILINYIPPATPPVRRARALVHSRRVGAIFKKHQTMLSVDNLSQLTIPMIHKALVEPDSFATPPPPPPPPPPAAAPPVMGASLSTEPNRKGRKPKPIALNLERRSFSETYAPHYPVPQHIPPVPPIPLDHKSSGMLGGFLRRKKKDDLLDHHEDGLPPPPPPKDHPSKYQQLYTTRDSPPPIYLYSYQGKQRASPTESFSELGVISHGHQYPRAGGPSFPPSLPRGRAATAIEYPTSLPLKGKWARDQTLSLDPKERERRRKEAQRQRELEDQRAMEEERQLQEERRWKREEDKRQEEEEEAERRIRLEEELRRIAAERERKRRWEEEEEERTRRELEEKKRIDRERRIEEHKRLEQWRKEREEATAEEARRNQEAKRQQELERQRKIQQAEKFVVQTKSKEPAIVTGWVTIQFHDSLFWKRRYYRFAGKQLQLYRSPEDTNSALETVELWGKVNALKEWKDGYEELGAIPFSFVVEFKEGPWSMYSDSEAEKFRFLGLIHHAAGL